MSELIENLSDLVGRKLERLIIISDFFFVFSEQAVGNHKVFFSCVHLSIFPSLSRARVCAHYSNFALFAFTTFTEIIVAC